MMLNLITGLAPLAMELIDRLYESDGEKAAAKAKLITLERAGDLERANATLSAIIAEAQARDPWTSRARPGFLYVMYLMIVSAIPMGVLFAFAPEAAGAVIAGMKGWLAAIPEPMWALFGAGYLGYVGARSWDKRRPG